MWRYCVISGSFVPTVSVQTLDLTMPLGAGVYRLARLAVWRTAGTAAGTVGAWWYERNQFLSAYEVVNQQGVSASSAVLIVPESGGRTFYSPGVSMLRLVPSGYGDTWAYSAIVERVG
jgi:hypothetical protein